MDKDTTLFIANCTHDISRADIVDQYGFCIAKDLSERDARQFVAAWRCATDLSKLLQE